MPWPLFSSVAAEESGARPSANPDGPKCLLLDQIKRHDSRTLVIGLRHVALKVAIVRNGQGSSQCAGSAPRNVARHVPRIIDGARNSKIKVLSVVMAGPCEGARIANRDVDCASGWKR